MTHWIVAFLGLAITLIEKFISDEDNKFSKKEMGYAVISILSVIALLIVFINNEFLLYINSEYNIGLSNDDIEWGLLLLSLIIGLLNYSIIRFFKKKSKSKFTIDE